MPGGEDLSLGPVSLPETSSDITGADVSEDASVELKTLATLESPTLLHHESLASTDAVLDQGHDDLDTLQLALNKGPTEKELRPDLEAFMAACQQGDLAHVTSSISSGRITANECFSDGVTGLHWACINNHIAVVKYLIENEHSRADPNIFGGELRATPLHWACRQGLVYIVDYLLHNSTADPCLRDSQSFNSLHLAVHTRSAMMVIYMLVTCASPTSKKHIHVDEIDQSKRTALHWAAYQGDSLLIKALIGYGANVTNADDTLFIPLHWAFMVGDKFALKALLEAGSDIRVKNSSGKDSFDIATDMSVLESWHKILRQDDRSPRLGWEKTSRWLDPKSGKIVAFFIPYLMLPLLFYTCSFSQGYWPIKVVAAAGETVLVVKLTEAFILPSFIREDAALSKSPFLAGIFTGTAFWGVVLWALCILPQTLTKRFFGNVSMAIVIVIFCWTYFKTLFINPGNVPLPSEESVRKAQVRELIASGNFDATHYCINTLVRKPLRSKFSRTTQKLVARFDHYCPWVYNDIGVRNHKLFITFVYSLSLAIVLFTSLSLTYFDKLEDGYESNDDTPRCLLLNDELCYAFNNHSFHFNYIVFCVIQMVWLTFLNLSQTFQILRGVTTYEFSRLGNVSQSILPDTRHRHKSDIKICLAMLGIDQLVLTIKMAAYSVISKLPSPISSLATAHHLGDSLGNLHIPSDFGVMQNFLDFWILGDLTFRNLFFLPIEGENNLNGQLVDYYKLYEWPLQMLDRIV